MVNAAFFGLGLMAATPLTLPTIAPGWLAHRPLLGGGLILAGIVTGVLIRRLVPRRAYGRPVPAAS